MKKITPFLIILLFARCTAFLYDPGTLGAEAINELNCPEGALEHELNQLIRTEQFHPLIKDSIAIDWWKGNGYDFLNYRCINLKGKLYMITIHSQNSNYTDISIRAYYNKKTNKWVFATDFNSVEKYNAEKAMDYLLNHISGCE